MKKKNEDEMIYCFQISIFGTKSEGTTQIPSAMKFNRCCFQQ